MSPASYPGFPPRRSPKLACVGHIEDKAPHARDLDYKRSEYAGPRWRTPPGVTSSSGWPTRWGGRLPPRLGIRPADEEIRVLDSLLQRSVEPRLCQVRIHPCRSPQEPTRSWSAFPRAGTRRTGLPTATATAATYELGGHLRAERRPAPRSVSGQRGGRDANAGVPARAACQGDDRGARDAASEAWEVVIHTVPLGSSPASLFRRRPSLTCILHGSPARPGVPMLSDGAPRQPYPVPGVIRYAAGTSFAGDPCSVSQWQSGD